MNNINSYIDKLNKSMTRKEKLFFLNKVKLQSYDYIIDFGGADGRLLYEVDRYMNKKHIDRDRRIRLINIDYNLDMVSPFRYSRSYSHLTDLDSFSVLYQSKVLLILSSVLHECSESTLNTIRQFIDKNVSTVVIRDMYLAIENRNDLIKTYCKLPVLQTKRYREVEDNNLGIINDDLFSSVYKNILNTYEYFLKYTYKENWETEVKERYFNSFAREFMMCLVARYGYKYIKRYVLPYKRKQVYKDFHYRMNIPTHIKLIIEK